jgi:hypothetical protein
MPHGAGGDLLPVDLLPQMDSWKRSKVSQGWQA